MADWNQKLRVVVGKVSLETMIQKAIELAQNTYCEHFPALIDFAEQEVLATRFEEQMNRFLTEVEVARRLLEDLCEHPEPLTDERTTTALEHSSV